MVSCIGRPTVAVIRSGLLTRAIKEIFVAYYVNLAVLYRVTYVLIGNRLVNL